MSILDDFINRKKGKSPRASVWGKSLLGQKQKSGKKANLLTAVGLGLKLKNHLHAQGIINDIEEFQLSQAPKRAGLVAEWTNQANIHALDERLKNEHGDNLNFYFNKKARENWTSLTGFNAPDISSDQFSDYQDWVAKESKRLTDSHEAKLKGAPLGKLTEEEVTAEFDRIVRATTRKSLAPSNINWFRGIIDNALGKDNDAKPNLDAISTHLDSLKKKPSSLNTPVTSGDMQVNTRDNRDFAESYVPDIADIDMATLANNFQTVYGNIDITYSEILEEISNIQKRKPRATAAQIQNILMSESYATEIQKNADDLENAESIISTYLQGDRSLSDVTGKPNRQVKLNKIQNAFNFLLNRDDTDASIKTAADLFSQQHGAELLNLPESSEASREEKVDIAERITMLIDRGQMTTGVQARYEERLTLDSENQTTLAAGVQNTIANQINQFAFDYPSINAKNNTIKNRLIKIGLLKYLGNEEHQKALSGERITLDNYYSMLLSDGEITEKEYMRDYFPLIINTASNYEEKVDAQTTAYDIVSDTDSNFNTAQKEEHIDAILRANDQDKITEKFLQNRMKNRNVTVVRDISEEFSDDGITYQDILEMPAIGTVADFAFGEEFGDSALDYAMFVPVGYGASTAFKLTAGAGKWAFKKALPYMGPALVKRLMANPYYSKLIQRMKLKNDQFTTPLRKPLKKDFKNDPRPKLNQFKNDPKPRRQDFDTAGRYERALKKWDTNPMKTSRQKYDHAIKMHKEQGSAASKYKKAMDNYNKNVKGAAEKQTANLKKYRDSLSDYEKAIFDSMNMKTGEINGTRLITNFMKTKGTQIATTVRRPFIDKKTGNLSKKRILLYGVGAGAAGYRGLEMFNEANDNTPTTDNWQQFIEIK
tara:strand:+ start:102 stop:2750 length:2649 start_codon:yes stop_codon:yes gene_type:complete